MIPLTILAGYLGSGKTTLLNNLLRQTSKPIGVLVNDFGELNIDSELIKNKDELTISLTNGCVCCNLNDDLGSSLEFISKQGIEGAVIEASGVAMPIKMANYGQTWPGFTFNGTIAVVEGQTIKHLLSDKFVSTTVKSQILQSDLVYLNRHSEEDINLISSLSNEIVLEENVYNFTDLVFNIDSTIQHKANLDIVGHDHFYSNVLITEKPIEKKAVRDLLANNPNVERIKGWISNKINETWLVQATKSGCNFSLSNNDTKTRLVIIHTKEISLDTLAAEL